MEENTLYQRLGGEAGISTAVDHFYERVLADPDLSHFFNSTSMARLKGHQVAFLSQALGGPKRYSGCSMEAAHAKLSIEQRHFDLVATHLVETMRGLGVSEEIIDEIAGAVTPLATQIVNSPTHNTTA